MSRLENCIERKKNGINPSFLNCMECLSEMNCPVLKLIRKEEERNEEKDKKNT